MPFTVESVDTGVCGLSHRRSGTIAGTKRNKNVNKTKQKGKRGCGESGVVRTEFVSISRTSMRKGG